MEILSRFGKDNVAYVYLGKTSKGNIIEFVESIQPPIPRKEKWVLIVSTLNGCPINCIMCDAGGFYKGKLTKDEILEQIFFLISKRYSLDNIPVKKFKIQFARMGEPALNMAVIDVLKELPDIINAPGLMPSISTVAPRGSEKFFELLLEVKEKFYRGRFQLQFSIHSTDENQRDRIIPVKKWDFKQIADYGEQFVKDGDRKITLNFALAKENTVNPEIIFEHFDPNKFLIKITPVNPTYKSIENRLHSDVDISTNLPIVNKQFVEKLRSKSYDVIISVGELEENQIGSNCGQYIQKHIKNSKKLSEGYQLVTTNNLKIYQ